MPEVDAGFAKSLGIADGDMKKMRDDIKLNLEREVGSRVKAKTKDSVMDALIRITELDVPKALVDQDIERLVEMTRQNMAQRGMNTKDMPLRITCRPLPNRSRRKWKSSRRVTRIRSKC
jgi:trigger factor